MTSQELHEQKIIPLRMELRKLEDEYRELYRKECGEKIGAIANCENCAYSCVLNLTEHNECMGGKCTCCNTWCYRWLPENEVSAFLRKNYHYDYELFEGVANFFGCDFLKNCDTPQKVNNVMAMLELVKKMEDK